MKTGEQLGPFVIEKPLGSGAMGTVYRARYTKTGGRVALKVVAPGLSDNEQSLARFEREAKILKQLNHPNIVRFYGSGRFQRSPFYAMEYVEGESLDRAMKRRDRLTWEELVALGRQLCSALQHAHEHGIIHRDLKPSNIMVLPDGTVKLTDFGIAKDMDETALTAANCTVGTASYMSPEQCRGDRDLTPKSDLYSLGVLFYELLTGRKPFQAETPMEMFMQHLHGTFERPSRLVLDTPVWLDTLICQLLEKKPEHRPRDAATVAEALERVAEKVAAQQSAGVDAARARAVDRPRGAAPADETDKAAARTLRQAVSGKKPRKRRKPFYRRVWFQAAVFGTLFVIAGGLLVYFVFLQKPDPDRLYRQAEKLMTSGDPNDWEKANDPYNGPLRTYVRYYAARDDRQAQQMREWADQVEAYECEQTLAKLVRYRKHPGPIPVEPSSDAQKDAVNATLAEGEGDLAQARDLWQKVEQKSRDSDRAWAKLAGKHLKDIKAAEDLSGRIDFDLSAGQDLNAQTEAEKLAQEGLTCERDARDDRAKAQECWARLMKQFEDDPAHRVVFLLAGKRARDLVRKPGPAEKGKAEEAPREKPPAGEPPPADRP